jgi:hypothetical protein
MINCNDIIKKANLTRISDANPRVLAFYATVCRYEGRKNAEFVRYSERKGTHAVKALVFLLVLSALVACGSGAGIEGPFKVTTYRVPPTPPPPPTPPTPPPPPPPPPDVLSGSYTLDFDSLPSAQGWIFMGDALAENDAFFVDGTRLVQRTVGSGTNAFARYQMDGVADPNKQMLLSTTVRVLGYEDLSGGSTGLGFNFYVSDGAFSYRLALTDALVQVGGQFYGLITTDFHDYRFELHPGGNFDLYVDGVIFATGVGSAPNSDNVIFFGDSTSHENTDAEVAAFSFAIGVD